MSNRREEGRASARAKYARRAAPHNSDTAAFEGHISDDLLLEILSRLPAKSLRRFRCVSRHWRGLIDHPDNRKRLAQPLAGFFNNSYSKNRFPTSAVHFVNASGRGRPLFSPSFAFLPAHRRLDLMDCCNGLILCYWYDASNTQADEVLVVCNPATEQWMVLPDPDTSNDGGDYNVGTVRLGFDPAVSSHFHVFLLLEDAHHNLSGVDVYSSETGTWIHKEKGWDQDIRLAEPPAATVFLNGCLHFRTLRGRQDRACIAAVDTKGGTWSRFDTPCDLYCGDQFHGLIQQLHGHLNYVSLSQDESGDLYLEVYALEDYANKRWTLKRRITVEEDAEFVFTGTTQEYFDWIAIHPDRNLIFFVRGSEKTVSDYSFDRRTSWEVHTLKEADPPYLPYVPLYSELESLHT